MVNIHYISLFQRYTYHHRRTDGLRLRLSAIYISLYIWHCYSIENMYWYKVTQLWKAKQCQHGYGPNAIKLINRKLFLAPSENVNKLSLLHITRNLQLDNIKLDFHSIFIGKHCFFLVFSCIIQNHAVTVWYYHLPLFINV